VHVLPLGPASLLIALANAAWFFERVPAALRAVLP